MATFTYKYDFDGGNYNGSTSYTQTYNTLVPSTSTIVAASKTGYKLRYYEIVASSTGNQLGKSAVAGQMIQVESNLTLKAIWDKIYYVKYDLDGGYFTSNFSYQNSKWYGFIFNVREMPYKTGYQFLYWKTDYPPYDVFNPSAIWRNDTDTTLIAQWSKTSINTFTITLDLNGGKAINPSGDTFKTSITNNLGTNVILPTPTRDGYVFSHWLSNRDNDYDGKHDTFTGGATYSYSNNVTLTAQWTVSAVITKEIRYVLSTRGSMDGDPSTHTEKFHGYSSPIVGKVSTTKPYLFGWNFSNWTKTYPTPSGVTYQGGETISMSTDWILSANWSWETKRYQVIFNLEGGSGGPSNLTYTDTGSGHVVTEAPSTWSHRFSVKIDTFPTRSGYTFKGWAVYSGGPVRYYPGQTYTINVPYLTSYNMYAVWEQNVVSYHYRINYNANGGTGAPASQDFGTSSSATYKGSVTTSVPSRDGYTFLGWGISPIQIVATYIPGSTIYLYGTIPTITLYAIWLSKVTYHYSIKYDTMGGSAITTTSGTSTDPTYSLIVTYSEPTREGYDFKGWSISQSSDVAMYIGGNVIRLTSSNNTITLYAIWEASVVSTIYYLYYNANGGTGGPSTQTKTTSASSCNFTVSSIIPTRSGYKFVGWGLNSLFATGSYEGGDVITVYKTLPSRLLYAIWVKEVDPTTYTYKLSFNANGGTDAPENLTFASTTYATTHTFQIPIAKPTRSGYTFAGWNTYQTATSGLYNTTSTVAVRVNETLTLYAVWVNAVTYKTYRLSFDANGGNGAPSSISRTTTDENVLFTIPNQTPKRTDYTFSYWLDSSAVDGSITNKYPGDQITLTEEQIEKVLMAQWEYTPSPTNDFTLHYNLSGGTGTILDQTYSGKETSHTFSITSIKPTKEESIFIGWSTSSVGSNADYSEGSYITLYPGTTTLYAIWSDVARYDYEIHYNTNGSSDVISSEFINDSANNQEMIVISSVIPNRVGYTFMGWSKNPSANPDSVLYTGGQSILINPGKNTFYSIWKLNTYQLIYNANGGLSAPVTEQRNYGTNTRLSLEKPTRDGYQFVGWSLVSDGNSIYSPGSYFYMQAFDTTLYAVWSLDSWTLTYSPNGGSIQGTNEFVYEYDQSVVVSRIEPTRNGYSFAGWGDRANDPTIIYNADDIFKMPNSNMVLYAQWEREYKLVFNPNGGYGGPSVRSYVTSENGYTFIIPSDIPYQDYHICTGWSRDPSATVPEYFSNDQLRVTWDDASYGVTTLYAVWERTFVILVKGQSTWNQVPIYQEKE